MKKILLLCLTFLSLFGCSEEQPENNTQEVTAIKYGTSFGECVGYCGNDLTITSSDVTLHKEGWYYNNALPTINHKEALESGYLQELFEKVNFEDFLELNEVIGCPDCADGGAEWLEIITKNQTHKVTFEYLTNETPELENILTTIRELNSSLQKDAYVVIDKDTYNSTSTDNYTITAVAIKGNILTLTILSSGCGTSGLITNLIDSGELFESSPLQRKLKVNLINKEACLAIVNKTYEIDISKLQVRGENELLLNIEGWDEKITYTY